MEFLFLQAGFNKESRLMELWCKDTADNYVLVRMPYDRQVFVAVNTAQLERLGLAGEPAVRLWGGHQKQGFLVSSLSLTKEHIEVLLAQERLFEHDIDVARQFLMTHALSTGHYIACEGVFEDGVFVATSLVNTGRTKEKLSFLAFDIETYTPQYAIRPEKYPVIMIGFYGAAGERIFTFKHMPDLPSVVCCASEQEMLLSSLRYIEEQKPDVLVGYNSDGFDWWYLLKRAQALRVQLTLCGHVIKLLSSRQRTVKTPGPCHVDLYAFCKSALRTTLATNSYSLNNVAAEVIGAKKLDVDLGELPEAWDTGKDLQRFFEYNKVDVQITYQLQEALLANMLVFGEFIHIDITDITRMGFAMLVEHFLMSRAFTQQQLIPALPSGDDLSSRHAFVNTGGYVFEPTPGVYRDIVVADFSSLYPSIIVSHNLDPSFSEEQMGEHGASPLGFIPATIQDLITARNAVKKSMKATDGTDLILRARSNNLKVLANAMYGYLSFAQSRWYSTAVAKKITSYGRYYVKKAIQETQDAGFEVLYSDTDSLFFIAPPQRRDEAFTHIKKLNDALPGIMMLDIDGVYPAGIFVPTRQGEGAKKKYALLRDDDTLKITGFEAIRHDWCLVARTTQRAVLQMVLRGDGSKVIVRYVQDVLASLTDGKIPLEQLVLTTKLQKPLDQYKSVGPHVTAAQRMLAMGKPVAPGSVISYVIVAGKGTLSQKTRLPEEVSLADLDTEYYVKHQIKPVLEGIFDVVGITFPGEQPKAFQRGLGSY